MSWYAPFVHILNFLLPAIWLASIFVVLHRTIWRKNAVTLSLGKQWGWLFLANTLILLLGLLLLQRDGAMLTYIAMAVVTGLVQAWILHRYQKTPQPAPHHLPL